MIELTVIDPKMASSNIINISLLLIVFLKLSVFSRFVFIMIVDIKNKLIDIM
ncbi:hypothetical protein H9661_05895 [Clostridium sp. Sa3CVN1]|uniref:Uncharacterized protein n=1 Tax=Clostridium cibarium TaxID=2762247 RepID=A0ABR8PS08_9CLOT|nr:hypothetical protein [Clostridium cibarium]